MFFQSNWQRPPVVSSQVFLILWVLYWCDFMISNEVRCYRSKTLSIKHMIIHPSFICNLMTHKLSMMPGRYTLINYFILFKSLFDGRINKLCHFNIVCEDVHWQIPTLSNCNEFLFVVVVICVLLILQIKVECVSGASSFECCERLNILLQLWIIFQIFYHKSTILSIKEFT